MRNILLFFIFIFSLIIIFEIALSRLIFKPSFHKIHVDPHGDGNYALSDNKNLIYTPLPNTADFNEYGHRGRSFPLEKPSDKKRILFIGDSVVVGVNVPAEQIFTELLNEKLFHRYEIINLGVSGYSIIQGFEYLLQYGIKFQPDHVLFGISFNDLQTLGSDELRAFNKKLEKMKNYKFYKNYYSYTNRFDNFMLRFSTYSFLKMHLFHSSPNRVFNDGLINIETIDNLLLRMKRWSEKTGIKITYVFFPGPINAFSIQPVRYLYEANIPLMKNLENKMISMNFSILNLENNFNDSNNKEKRNELFLDNIHFSPKGHELVTKFIFDYIKNQDNF